MDAAAGNALRDDARRHGREAREREAEQQTLAALYAVRGDVIIYTSCRWWG
jgi:hypothetical protein